MKPNYHPWIAISPHDCERIEHAYGESVYDFVKRHTRRKRLDPNCDSDYMKCSACYECNRPCEALYKFLRALKDDLLELMDDDADNVEGEEE